MPRPSTILHAAVAAGVLERPHTHVLGAHHDDRLVEELVLDEVAGLGDLLEPAGHLPDPRPEQLGLHLVEVRVEVALLGDPVGELHRVGHRKRRPLLIHDRHLPPLVPDRPANMTNRSVQLPTVRIDRTDASIDTVTPRRGLHDRHPDPAPTAQLRPTSTCWSSAPASPASTSCTGRARPASPPCCSRPAAGWAGPGTGTATPGARFDSESYTYAYLFSKELFDEWEWQEHFAEQPEIERYLNHVVDRFDLRRHIRFGAEVTAADLRRGVGTWTVTAGDGIEVRARFLVAATGVLSVPYFPDVPGREDFRGESYHTGLWPATPVDFAGKRVAVIGTGSSGVQIDPGHRRRGRVAHRVPAHRQLVHAAQQRADHARGAGRSCGPTSRRCARC